MAPLESAPAGRDWPAWAFELAPLRVTARYRAEERVELPPYAGGTLRGALGHALRHTACACRPTCTRCRSPHTCTYSYLFESPPPPDTRKLRLYPHIPHPLVIEPPEEGLTEIAAGECLRFGLVLVGRARGVLPFLVVALDRAARHGLGHGRGRLAFESLESESGELLFDRSSGQVTAPTAAPLPSLPVSSERARVELWFRTPTRVVSQGRFIPEPEPWALFRALLRRISSLYYFHCAAKSLPVDFRGLAQRAAELERSRCETSWKRWNRWSSRQNRMVSMDGFVGKVAFEGAFGELLPFLHLGEWVHVGKATAFGHGRYEVTAMSAST